MSLGLVLGPSASPEPEPDPHAEAPVTERPRIVLEFVGDSPLADDILADLRALLERDGIDVELAGVEVDGRRARPLAVVRVEFRPETAVFVAVDIRDAVTDKRIGRDLDLDAVPVEGHSLMIAAAADELLDASWAEVVLWRPDEAHEPVPEVVHEVVARELGPAPREAAAAPAARLSHRVAAGALGLWTSGGLGSLGASLVYELRVVGRVGVELGGRGFGVVGPRLDSGTVRGGGGLGQLGLTVATRPPGRLELDLGGHVAIGQVALTGISAVSGVRRSRAGLLVELGGAIVPSVDVGEHLRVELPLSVAGVVRGIEVLGDGGPVTAMNGVVLACGLRVAWFSWSR